MTTSCMARHRQTDDNRRVFDTCEPWESSIEIGREVGEKFACDVLVHAPFLPAATHDLPSVGGQLKHFDLTTGR